MAKCYHRKPNLCSASKDVYCRFYKLASRNNKTHQTNAAAVGKPSNCFHCVCHQTQWSPERAFIYDHSSSNTAVVNPIVSLTHFHTGCGTIKKPVLCEQVNRAPYDLTRSDLNLILTSPEPRLVWMLWLDLMYFHSYSSCTETGHRCNHNQCEWGVRALHWGKGGQMVTLV